LKNPPSVDVVIAAANEAQDIEGCLRSFQGQQYPGEVRVFVALDERSRDGTGELAIRSGATVLQAGRGAADLRNQAVKLGRGSLLAFLDAHCFAHPGWLLALVKRIRETAAAGVGGRIVYQFTEGRDRLQNPNFVGSAAAEKSAYAWLRTGNCLYSRQAFEEAGGFDTALRSCEDVDLAWRILLRGVPLAFCSQAVVTHLDRQGSWAKLRRAFFYGVGAGQLAYRFGLAGPARPKLGDLQSGCYHLGAWLGRNLLCSGVSRFQARPIGSRWTQWEAQVGLRLHPGLVWWYAENEVVLVGSGRRMALEGAGQFFWRGLSRGWNRQQVIERTCRASHSPVPGVAQDLDEWVDTLCSEGWLERSQISSGE